jgi:hypothetical protein
MMFFCLLFIFSILHADSTIEKYCFESPEEARIAYREISFLKLPQDKFEVLESCLQVSISISRVELLQKYILSEFPSAQIKFSNSQLSTKECNLSIEKEIKSKSKSLSGEFPSLYPITANEGIKAENEVTNVRTLGPFEISHSFSQILGNCRLINKDEYDIQLSYSKKNNIFMPSRSKELSFSTHIRLVRGQRIEILSLQQNPEKDQKNIILPKGLKAGYESEDKQTKIYLSIK